MTTTGIQNSTKSKAERRRRKETHLPYAERISSSNTDTPEIKSRKIKKGKRTEQEVEENAKDEIWVRRRFSANRAAKLERLSDLREREGKKGEPT